MSQLDLIKRHLNEGGSLTVLTAIQKYGVYALSQRMGDLRKDGFPVDKKWIKLPSGKKVVSYSKKKGKPNHWEQLGYGSW